MQDTSASRAEVVAAWAIGIGIGWIAFMVTWLIANRVTGLLLPTPQAPITAMTLAIVIGFTVSIWQGRRLVRSVRTHG